MERVYVIDAGNSRVKIGQFSKGKLITLHSYPKEATGQLYNFLNHCDCDKVMISSVSIDEKSLIKALPNNVDVHVLTGETKLPMTMSYTTPESLGKDRIAVVAAAVKIWEKEPVLVVDAGSCMTIDLVNENAHWVGGNISPGLYMRWQAMHDYTERLPLVNSKSVKREVWGVSTDTALGNGGLWGLVEEIEGYFYDVRTQFPNVKLVLTGGDAPFLAEFMKTKIFVEPNLVLIGLHEIFQNNN